MNVLTAKSSLRNIAQKKCHPSSNFNSKNVDERAVKKPKIEDRIILVNIVRTHLLEEAGEMDTIKLEAPLNTQ